MCEETKGQFLNDLNEDGSYTDKLSTTVTESEAAVLMLPHGVRNISTKMLESNSIMLDSGKKYAVAGVRYANLLDLT